MDIKERIAEIKHKASMFAIKVATVTTMAAGTGATLTSCNNNTDKDGDKIENVEDKNENVEEKNENTVEKKTSVVFRSTHHSSRYANYTDVLMENGDQFKLRGNDRFLEPGDTLTYNYETRINGSGNEYVAYEVEAVRYKGNAEVKKKVDFGKIGKLEKGR